MASDTGLAVGMRHFLVDEKACVTRVLRIGTPRAFFYAPIVAPGTTAPRGGLTPAQAAVMKDAIDVLKNEGAVVVDPADIPSVVTTDANGNARVRMSLTEQPRGFVRAVGLP